MDTINGQFGQDASASENGPASTGHAQAVLIQRIIAGAVVLVPFMGLILAVALGMQAGFHYQEFVILAVGYVLGMLGITLGFHRYFAHKSFKTSKAMEMFLMALGSSSAQGPLYFWVATHRRHHLHSDKEGDPHSPNLFGDGFKNMLRGFWYGHIGWMFSDQLTDWVRFVPDLLRKPNLFKWQSRYFIWVALGLAVPTLAGYLWIGGVVGALKGFLWGGLVRIFLVNQASWLVGSVSHMFGSHPFRDRTQDLSCNNWWVALLSFGEGNQNNHHAFANSAKQGLEWWQPDFTYKVILVLKASGLIWDVHVPSKTLIEQRRDIQHNSVS